MSVNALVNPNSNVPLQMAERQSGNTFNISTPMNPIKNTTAQNSFFIPVQYVPIPVSVPVQQQSLVLTPPPAFQPQPQALAQPQPKLNAAVQHFTPMGPLPPQQTTLCAQLASLWQQHQYSLAKLSMFAAQLNALQTVCAQQSQSMESQPSPDSVMAYQNVYTQYQLEFGHSLLLTQHINSLRAIQSLPAPMAIPIPPPTQPQTQTQNATPTPTRLETIDEGEDEEPITDTDDIAKAMTPKLALAQSEGTVLKSPLSLLSPDGEKIPSWKFPKITQTQTQTGSTTLMVSGESETTSETTCTTSTSTTEEEEEEKVKDRAQEQKDLTRRIRSILNKISPENFDKLSQDIASMLPTPTHSQSDAHDDYAAAVKLVLRCILVKAQCEPLFSNEYARLCYSLYLYAGNALNGDDGEAACEWKQRLFRRQLLELTHSAFKRARRGHDERQLLGVMSMVGELFVYGLISWHVLSQGIFQQLIHAPSPKNIAGLCRLLRVCGYLVDRQHRDEMDRLVADLRRCGAQFGFRTRCLVQQIVEMRCNEWAHRHATSVSPTSNRRASPPRQQRVQHYDNRQFGAPSQAQHQFGGGNGNRWNNVRNSGNSGNSYQRNNVSSQSHQSHSSRRPHHRTKSVKPSVEFVADVTVPDRSHHLSGKVLTKTWAMRNSGEFAWGDGVELAYFKGDAELSVHSRYPVKSAVPGETVQLSALIHTPQKGGRYCTYFRLQMNGKFFGPRVWCDIIVENENEAQ